jgi:glycosyltransferase involved in cell wall biosynthesis
MAFIVDGHEESFSDPSLPLAVVVARTRWAEPPRMRHQLTRQLLRRFNVVFVELFHERGLAPQHDHVRMEMERLMVFSPGLPRPVSAHLYTHFPPTHHAVNVFLQRKISQMVASLRPQTCLLVNFVYDLPELMADRQFDHTLYICYDEFPRMWRQAAPPNRLKYTYQAWLGQRYEDLTARRAGRVLATHTALVRKLQKVNPRTTLFLHGHELPGLKNTGMRARDGRIKVGFMGYINYRLLVEWLLALLADPQMDLALIGPLCKFDLAPLEKFANFRHIPAVSGTELEESLLEMDVLILPYDPAPPENQVQTVSNKFFQYLAAGRPVVLSDLPDHLEMPAGVLYRARNAVEFAAQVRRAYEQDCPAYVQVRQAIAAENTWDKRGAALFAMLAEDLPALQGAEAAGQ